MMVCQVKLSVRLSQEPASSQITYSVLKFCLSMRVLAHFCPT